MSDKTYTEKYRGKSEIGYKTGRRGWLGFWINLNLIINIAIIAGMISAVFSIESMIGTSSDSAYSWARWILYAVIAIYIVLFIQLVVSIRKDLDDSRAQMRLFNYRSISVIARKILTILYTVFMCFILVDGWISGVVGSESLIFVIGIIIIVFYVLMIAVDVFKIVMRRRIYENTKKKRHLKKGRVQTMKRDLECQQILVEQKIIETRALKNSMVFRLLSIDKNRTGQDDMPPDYEPSAVPSSEETNAVETAVAVAMETPINEAEISAEPEGSEINDAQENESDTFGEGVAMTMEELQQIAVVRDEEAEEISAEEADNDEIDNAQMTFDELEPQSENDETFAASTALSKDFAAIFDFRSCTGI